MVIRRRSVGGTRVREDEDWKRRRGVYPFWCNLGYPCKGLWKRKNNGALTDWKLRGLSPVREKVAVHLEETRSVSVASQLLLPVLFDPNTWIHTAPGSINQDIPCSSNIGPSASPPSSSELRNGIRLRKLSITRSWIKAALKVIRRDSGELEVRVEA